MCLLAKTWNLDPKLWLWEFKQKSFIKENLHFFFRNRPQQQLHKYTRMRCLFGEGFPNYEGYTHFWSGKIGFPIPILDPSWMDVSCGVLGPGFRWISRIHWTSSPSSTGATRLFGGLRLTPKKKNAKKRRWRLVIIIIYHIYIIIYIYIGLRILWDTFVWQNKCSIWFKLYWTKLCYLCFACHFSYF